MYTKGEWKIDTSSSEADIFVLDESLPYYKQYIHIGNINTKLHNAQANANLIAQSPRMAEELNDIIFLMGNTVYETSPVLHKRIMETLSVIKGEKRA